MGYFSALTKHSTLESRGILSLSPKDSWLPNTADAVQYDIYKTQNYSRADNSFLATAAGVDSPEYPYQPINSSLSWDLDSTLVKTTVGGSPDLSIASIFTTSLQITNGSAATALSTIITILASMEYYDQFPNFAETAHDVSTTYFQPFLFPQSLRGFIAVLAISAVHFLLIAIIAAAFVTTTRLTTLGDHWQTISQTISPATKDFLEKSSRATDKEVRQGLKVEQREHEVANIQLLDDGCGRVGLVARKAHRSGSDDMDLE